MIDTKPLAASEIRSFARGYAEFFAALLDNLPSAFVNLLPHVPATAVYELSYDDAAAVTVRLLVENGPVFCRMVELGTGLAPAAVQAMSWPEVVKIGCHVFELTLESWRPAWPNGFLQGIIRDELRPFSRVAAGVARS